LRVGQEGTIVKFEMEAIGHVEGGRDTATDDYWGGAESWIVLADRFEEDALLGIEAFSHAEILFVFHGVDPASVVCGARLPRGNPAWPRIGIFAQRAKGRPNRIGSTICRVLERQGRRLRVAELDAIAGTPVLDVKPVLREFLPRTSVEQPEWSRELMREYWDEPKPR
jgi:tRNA (adenine37-N6)-methyltransferase